MAPSQGYAAKLGIGATSTVNLPLDFLNESLMADEEFVDRNGIRGTRSHIIEPMRQGIRRIGGSITLQPTAVELTTLLPWILGTPAVGNLYALAETVPAMYVSIDRVLKVFQYDGCKVNRAVFSGSAGQPLTVTLDLIGIDETVNNAGTFPSLTLDTTTDPFMFHDCVLVINSVTYNAPEIEIVVDNMLDTERFFNSATRTSITAQNREISVNTRLGYGDASAAYATGIGGVGATATFTNGATSLLFDFVKVVFPRKSPTVAGKTEIMMPMQGTAKMSSTTLELVTTLDSAP